MTANSQDNNLVVSMNEELEERVIIPVSPDLNIPKGGFRRNSDGKASVRSSPSLSSNDEKPLPNYLRASTGSCHDFCKYGRHHIFETKDRRPLRSAFLANSRIPGKERDRVKVPSIGQRKKKPAHRVKTSSSKPKVGSSSSLEVIKQINPSPQELHLSDTTTRGLDDSSAGVMLESLSLPSAEQTLSHEDDDSLEESINRMTPSLIEKHVISYEVTPTNKAKESVEENISMNLETPMPSENSITSDSSEEPESLEVMMVPHVQGNAETALDSEGEASLSEEELNMELRIPLPVPEATGYVEQSPADEAKGSSDMPVSLKETTATTEHSILPTAFGNDTPTENQLQVKRSLNRGDRQNKQVMKLKSTPQPKTGISRRSKVSNQTKTDSTGMPAIIKKQSPLPVKKNITSVKLKVLKQNSPPSSVDKVIASPTARSIKLKALSPPKKTNVSAKPSISLKTKTSVLNSASPSVPSEGRAALRKKENKVVRSVELPKIREEKIFKPPRASISPKPSVNGISSLRSEKYGKTSSSLDARNQEKAKNVKADNEKVKEKTLYVVEPKSDNRSLKPMHQRSWNRRSSSLSTASVTSRDEDNKESESSYTEDKRRLRRSMSIHSEEKVPLPHKLRFRRGKVVDPQSENNGPRRLRFRQPRLVTVNQTAKEVVARNLGNTRELDGSGLNEPKIEAPTVVLRHQDQQGKRDTQGLFNHVIEETASKLVETRKSKVKALVGAFETVISLQESKVVPLV